MHISDSKKTILTFFIIYNYIIFNAPPLASPEEEEQKTQVSPRGDLEGGVNLYFSS
jgi:hypothetical protein